MYFHDRDKPARIKVTVKVIDSGGYEITDDKYVPLSEKSILLSYFITPDHILPGITADICMIPKYPDGSPIEGALLTMRCSGCEENEFYGTTDASGHVCFNFTPAAYPLRFTGQISKDSISENFTVDISEAFSKVIIIPDRTECRPGQKINITLIASSSSEIYANKLYVDVVKENTLETLRINLNNGKGYLAITCNPEYAPYFFIRAYMLDRDITVFDKIRINMIESYELPVNVNTNRSVYEPAEFADIEVRTEANTSVLLSVVDMATHSLKEKSRGFDFLKKVRGAEAYSLSHLLGYSAPEMVVHDYVKDIENSKITVLRKRRDYREAVALSLKTLVVSIPIASVLLEISILNLIVFGVFLTAIYGLMLSSMKLIMGSLLVLILLKALFRIEWRKINQAFKFSIYTLILLILLLAPLTVFNVGNLGVTSASRSPMMAMEKAPLRLSMSIGRGYEKKEALSQEREKKGAAYIDRGKELDRGEEGILSLIHI